MRRKTVSGVMLSLLLIGMLILTFNIRPVKASGTIYIRYDGSIEGTTHISTVDNVTYTFTDNIVGDVPAWSNAIEVQRDNIVIDGAGYTLQGTGAIGSTGIFLSIVTGASSITIKNIAIKSFDFGIFIDSINNTIIDNNITNNSNGIVAAFSNYNNITGNIITNNGGGIGLEYSSDNNTIYSNTISNNDWGIEILWKSYNNTITGNNITDNSGNGINIRNSNNTILYGNNVTNNGKGIDLYYSSNNLIYHNNFINNTQQVYIYYSGYAHPNVWDNGYPSGGNYWSDHVCTGNPSDGSQPYIADADNIDHYPFQDLDGWLPKLTITSSPITGITFTINGTQKTTPYTEWLLEGFYTLIMPETHNGYVWSHWLEDGDPNRIKTILLQRTTWTAVYEPAHKPVGGKATPINIPLNKPETPTLWIWLTTIILPLVLTVVYIKKRKRNPRINS